MPRVGNPKESPLSTSQPDRLTWAEIRRLALRHKKALWIANGVAVLATLCSVPIPLLLPLLVDEVLLGNGDADLTKMVARPLDPRKVMIAGIHHPLEHEEKFLSESIFSSLWAETTK